LRLLAAIEQDQCLRFALGALESQSADLVVQG
jgi:hypothetical protein